MNIGSAIRQVREGLGYSQEKLSDKTGLSQTSISQIENGVKTPSKKTIDKICKVLGVPADVLYILGIDVADIPKNKVKLYGQVYPKIKELADLFVNHRKKDLMVD
jgi:transcriptional regulator with XRE-family HTH domain